MNHLLSVTDLVVHFPTKRGVVHAVNGISFFLDEGETVGLVGETGSGKSTTGFAIVRKHKVAAGRIVFAGDDITSASRHELRPLRRSMQLVFQDPFASLDPTMTVGQLIAEPLIVHKVEASRQALDQRVADLLTMCGLSPDAGNLYPRSFSGGQRQRIAIARALALNPRLIVADEVVSALDVSIKSQITNLMVRLQEENGISYLFISHDLNIVRNIAHRVLIMYYGHIVEAGRTEDVFSNPLHPYTVALLSASPIPDPRIERARERLILPGDVPDMLNPPTGCPFHSRCPLAIPKCVSEPPPTLDYGRGRTAACWRSDDVSSLIEDSP